LKPKMIWSYVANLASLRENILSVLRILCLVTDEQRQLAADEHG